VSQPSFIPSSPARSRDNDSDLLSRCALGDREAWGALVHRYRELVWSTALKTGLGPPDAEDVFQEVFLELWRSASRIRNPSALPRWLLVATRRRSYKVAVQRRRILPQLTLDLIDPAALPEHEVIAAESRVALERGLEKIDSRCAEMLRVLFFSPEPPSYGALSKQLGIARGSIGPIRIRCLDRLRRALEEWQ
jgi:RNA polymerase sigma factor (sigma-70 family)